MNWFDISILVFLIACAAVGARLGSLWTGICLFGGFAGSFLADTYVYSLSDYLGKFSGSFFVAWILLFFAGLAIILTPGFILSKVGSVFLAGFIDSAVGLFAGIFAGTVLVALAIFFIFPFFPKLEKQVFWKDSKIVRPAYLTVEKVFEKNFLKRKMHKNFSILSGIPHINFHPK